MEFTPFKKDRNPDADGHYPWESPGLRARLDAERKAAKPRVVVGVMSPAQTWAQSQRDRDMVERDQPKAVGAEKPAAESGCLHGAVAPWYEHKTYRWGYRCLYWGETK